MSSNKSIAQVIKESFKASEPQAYLLNVTATAETIEEAKKAHQTLHSAGPVDSIRHIRREGKKICFQIRAESEEAAKVHARRIGRSYELCVAWATTEADRAATK